MGEFSYGRVWPNPLTPEDDYEFEQLIEGDSPGEWPGLLEGTGYLHWAVVGLAARGHIDDVRLVEFLRAQDGLSAIGDVEVIALQGQTTHEGAFPFAVESVVNLLSDLRAGGRRAQRASQRAADKAIARVLVEPWLMITPGVPEEILRYIASDPNCPAHLLATEGAGPPSNGSRRDQEHGNTAAPDEWEIRRGVTGARPRLEESNHKARSVKGLLSASDSSAADARDQLAAFIERIAESVPEPTEDADEESLEGLVGRHLQYLQASVWLDGEVWVPPRMIKAWIRRLDALADLIEEGDDEGIAAAAYGSWSMYGK